MYRIPVRLQRSPGAPRLPGRFPSPSSCWGFPGVRSPYGTSPRGCATYSTASNRGYADRSHTRRRADRRPPSFSPNFQSSDLSVEKYFSPSMMQDPWAALQPLTATDAARRTT